MGCKKKDVKSLQNSIMSFFMRVEILDLEIVFLGSVKCATTKIDQKASSNQSFVDTSVDIEVSQMWFIDRRLYSATSFAKNEFLFSRSRTGTSYSATLPAP
jgi:hypothetical protein